VVAADEGMQSCGRADLSAVRSPPLSPDEVGHFFSFLTIILSRPQVVNPRPGRTRSRGESTAGKESRQGVEVSYRYLPIKILKCDTDLRDDDNMHNNPDNAPGRSHNKRGHIECDTTETTASTLRIVHSNVPSDYKGAQANENIRYLLTKAYDEYKFVVSRNQRRWFGV